MSVSASAGVKMVQFGGRRTADHLPAGIWYGQVSVSGDASGGIASLELNPESLDVQGDWLWSWEEATCLNTADGTIAVQFAYITSMLDRAGNVIVFRKRRAIQNVSTGINSVTDERGPSLFGIIADTDRKALLTGWQSHIPTNPGAGNSFSMAAWGYFWRRAALNQPGGPRRW